MTSPATDTSLKDGVNRELSRNSVYHRLREDILSCKLRPGQALQEKDLLDLFSLSRSPIRDALLKLEEQGLIEVMPRKGYRVQRIELNDVRDMYGVRHMVEREAATLMIANASHSVMAGLDAFRDPCGLHDLADWARYNRQFHSYILNHCGNQRLARLSLGLIEQFDRLTFISVTHPSPVSFNIYNQEHSAIIDALQARDRRQALKLIRNHIESSRKRVMTSLETFPVVNTQPDDR